MMDEVTRAGWAVAAARAVIAKAGVNFSYMAVEVGGEPKIVHVRYFSRGNFNKKF